MPSIRIGQVAAPVLLALAVASVAAGTPAAAPGAHVAHAQRPPVRQLASRPTEVDPPQPPAPTPTPAPPPTPTATPAPRLPIDVGPAFAVGDSTMIDIQAYLGADIAGITVDGRVSRQFGVGVAIVAGLHAAGRLPPIVVVDLGTNGTVTNALFDAMMSAAQGARRVVFCTVHVPRTWESGDNAVIRAGVARYPNAALADWFSLSEGHPEWFAPDGYHIKAAGSKALAALIAAVL